MTLATPIALITLSEVTACDVCEERNTSRANSATLSGSTEI
jgi:hypothetical protein